METKFELLVKRARKVIEQAGMDMAHGDCMPYELILEAGIMQVADRIRFNVLIFGLADHFITEIRLHLQDIFICNEWGLFLLNTDGRLDIGFEEHTFVDPKYFDATNRAQLEILYNANLRFVVNNQIVLQDIRTDIFKRYKPVTERRNDCESGLLEMEQLLIMPGTRNIYFDLDLPRKADFFESGIRVRLRLGGLLLRNSIMFRK
jgi:hypothetical protein